MDIWRSPAADSAGLILLDQSPKRRFENDSRIVLRINGILCCLTRIKGTCKVRLQSLSSLYVTSVVYIYIYIYCPSV